MNTLPELAWIAEAKKYIGLQEVKGSKHNPTILTWLSNLKAWWSDDESAWCATFVAHCLQVAGVAFPKHWYRALDYTNYGTRISKPAYGCVAIKTRKEGGHVCFVVGQTKQGKLVCLGGNQNDKVSYAIFDPNVFTAFRWYGRALQPNVERYNLPIITNVSETKISEA